MKTSNTIPNNTKVIAVSPYGTEYPGVVVGWDSKTGQYIIRHEGVIGTDLWEPKYVTLAHLELEPLKTHVAEENRELINFCKRDPWERIYGKLK